MTLFYICDETGEKVYLHKGKHHCWRKESTVKFTKPFFEATVVRSVEKNVVSSTHAANTLVTNFFFIIMVSAVEFLSAIASPT